MPTTAMTRRHVLAALLTTALGCRRRKASPEDRVRELVASLEKAVEDKDLGPVREAVSESYQDAQGDRSTLLGTLQLLFTRYPKIHLAVRVSSVDVPEPGLARANLVVAMASVPVSGVDDLLRARADVYEFTVRFADEEGAFKVVGAKWAPARIEMFR
jgi:hypothetical protein